VNTKEKIKLLSDMQEALDSEELKLAVLALSSGERIWQVFERSIQAEVAEILSPAKAEAKEIVATEKSITQIARTVLAIENSNTYSLLKSIHSKLDGSLSAAPTPQPQQQAQARAPDYQEEEPESQEEMQRKFEEQVTRPVPRNPRGRGSGPGMF
jgi:uncharacterized protein (DUF2126 family)